MAICEPSCGSRTAGRSKVACSTAPWAWAWPRNAASAETRRATSRIVDVTVSSLPGDTKRSFPGSNAHASPCVPRPARLRPCAARLGRYPKLRASASCRLRGLAAASAHHVRIPRPRGGRGRGEGEWSEWSGPPSPCPLPRGGRGAVYVAAVGRAHDLPALVDELPAQEGRGDLAGELSPLERGIALGRRRVRRAHREALVWIEQRQVRVVAGRHVALGEEAVALRRVPRAQLGHAVEGQAALPSLTEHAGEEILGAP